MQTDSVNNAATKQIITQVLNAWTAENKKVTDFFSKYADEVYMQEIAEGRNRAIYLLGHLVAVNDALLPLMGFGERLYPELEQPFLRSADRATEHGYNVADLKQKWQEVNELLSTHFAKLEPSDWLDRHMSVSPEDFAKEPHRNRLNVILGRTNHQASHMGQLNLLHKHALAD